MLNTVSQQTIRISHLKFMDYIIYLFFREEEICTHCSKEIDKPTKHR